VEFEVAMTKSQSFVVEILFDPTGEPDAWAFNNCCSYRGTIMPSIDLLARSYEGEYVKYIFKDENEALLFRLKWS
jgi:hypothetical protein